MEAPLNQQLKKRERVQQTFTGPSLTQQHSAKEADINHMVETHLRRGGTLMNIGDPRAVRKPMWGDFTSLDFQEMQNSVADIEQKFAAIPARLRSRFKNDPYQLLRWLEKPENQDEAVKLRLIPDPSMEDPFIDENQLDIVKEAAKGPPAPLAPSSAPAPAAPAAPSPNPAKGS